MERLTDLANKLDFLATLLERPYQASLETLQSAALASFRFSEAAGDAGSEARELLSRILRDLGVTTPKVAPGPKEMYSPELYAEELRTQAARLRT